MVSSHIRKTKSFRSAQKMTIADWIGIWQRDYLLNVKQSTSASYSQSCGHILPVLGAIRLQELEPHMVQHLITTLREKGLSPKTIHNVHGVLHKALQQALQIFYVDYNAADFVTLPRVERAELEVLDMDGTIRFLRRIQGERYEDVFRFILFTGVREGEALGLTWDCVDFATGKLWLKQQLQKEKKRGGRYLLTSLKNDRPRMLIPAKQVLELLAACQTKQNIWKIRSGPAWKNHMNLVFTQENGDHICAPTILRDFKRVAADIGQPALRIHDLRHSYAVAALQAGDDIKTLQQNLGHATAAFTLNVYGHCTEDMQRASSARMAAYLAKLNVI